MTIYELMPKFESRKSFYGKARVEIDNQKHTSTLISYTTEVARITSGLTHAEDKAEVFGTYSPTTIRHIKEFLKQFGFKAESKAQIERDYMNN